MTGTKLADTDMSGSSTRLQGAVHIIQYTISNAIGLMTMTGYSAMNQIVYA